jgi:hypothetical protein
MNSTILVTCGATAADIRAELGPRCKVQKVKPFDAIGNYGDFLVDVFDADAVLMKLKYPDVVRAI